MLKHLYISDFALIDTLDIDIKKGFSVITGETGAGKSIIIGALGLILGDRADFGHIRAGAAKCVVEATFDISGSDWQLLFEELELDYQPECIIRREITTSGRSRAFINDTPVTAARLKSVSSRLIDIHSQYANLLLNDAIFQIHILDSVADTDSLLNEYHALFSRFIESDKRLAELKQTADEWRAERDYALYRYERLVEADLKSGEQEQLEKENELLSHAEDIKSSLSSALLLCDDERCGIISSLKDMTNCIGKAASHMETLSLLSDRVNSLYIEIKDLHSELSDIFDNMDFDPARRSFVTERLDSIYSLQQKYKVDSEEKLIALRDEYAEKLQRIDGFDEEILKLERQTDALRREATEVASRLSEKRRASVGYIADYIVGRLKNLGMPNATVEIIVDELPRLSVNGMDSVNILFSANKNAGLKPIASIASGGEMSRVMLVLKGLMAQKSDLSTIIFDEIDTGVSGDVAGRMGGMLKELAADISVIAITHLPQIAAKGDSHFKVYKVDTDDSTVSRIKELSLPEREMEIAEMLSGKNPTITAIETAKELLHD